MRAKMMRVKNIGVDFVNNNDMGYNIHAKSLFNTANIRLTFKEFNRLKLSVGDRIKVYYANDPWTGKQHVLGCKSMNPEYEAIVIS